MRTSCSGTFALAAVLLGAGGAHAAADAVPPALRACTGVKKNSERLACYDQAIGENSSVHSGADANTDGSALQISADDNGSNTARAFVAASW